MSNRCPICYCIPCTCGVDTSAQRDAIIDAVNEVFDTTTEEDPAGQIVMQSSSGECDVTPVGIIEGNGNLMAPINAVITELGDKAVELLTCAGGRRVWVRVRLVADVFDVGAATGEPAERSEAS